MLFFVPEKNVGVIKQVIIDAVNKIVDARTENNLRI